MDDITRKTVTDKSLQRTDFFHVVISVNWLHGIHEVYLIKHLTE